MATKPLVFQVGLILVGLALLVVGSRLLVGSATQIAEAFGVSDLIIGLTVVAAGTSLPELATSVMAAISRPARYCRGQRCGLQHLQYSRGAWCVRRTRPVGYRSRSGADSARLPGDVGCHARAHTHLLERFCNQALGGCFARSVLCGLRCLSRDGVWREHIAASVSFSNAHWGATRDGCLFRQWLAGLAKIPVKSKALATPWGTTTLGPDR